MARISIALQLHSVHKAFRDDPAGVLKSIAAMGYDGVEFAGFHNQRPVTLRRLLAEAGLRCAGAHVPFTDILKPRLEESLIYQQALGNPNLVVSSLPEEYLQTESGWQQAAALLTGAADRAMAFGLRIGYHNHEIEFARRTQDGRSFWDVFFYLAGSSVFMQPDTGHAARAGIDPSVLVRQNPGRVKTVHLREWSPEREDALIGEGEVPWERIFRACTVSGTEWYIVEQESTTLPPLDCARRNLQLLRMMLRAQA
jgi:sugar phosphate isomerase/epimerase